MKKLILAGAVLLSGFAFGAVFTAKTRDITTIYPLRIDGILDGFHIGWTASKKPSHNPYFIISDDGAVSPARKVTGASGELYKRKLERWEEENR